MSLAEIIHEALELKPQERYAVIEELTRSLDVPNPEIEQAWIDVSLRRAEAYRNGSLETVGYAEAFGQ
jgi:hypothetical protein